MMSVIGAKLSLVESSQVIFNELAIMGMILIISPAQYHQNAYRLKNVHVLVCF